MQAINSGALTFGNTTAPSGVQSHLDEVRLANLARPPSWFALQQLSLTDAAWQYGTPK